jgi:hypothetical protein
MPSSRKDSSLSGNSSTKKGIVTLLDQDDINTPNHEIHLNRLRRESFEELDDEDEEV